MLGAEGEGAQEGQGGDQQRRPDEELAILHAVRGPGHPEHGQHGSQIGQGGQPAGLDDVQVGALAQDRWQPDDEAIDADAPAEVLQRQQDDLGRAEGFGVVLDRLHALLLGLQRLFQAGFFLSGEPLGILGTLGGQAPPDEGPDHRRQAFDDEHPAPVQGMDQIARDHRHPENGHRVAEDQEGIGPRALTLGEPVAEIDQHRRHHRRFDDAEQEADGDEQGDVGHHARQGSEAAPGDQAPEDQSLDAALFGIDGAGHLEEEIAEKEQGAEQGGHRRGDAQVVGHARGGGETVVGPVEVGQAVGDEDHWHQIPPAAWSERRGVHEVTCLIVLVGV